MPSIDFKPTGFTERVKELIIEKKSYVEANEILKKEFDGVGLAGSNYSKVKGKLFPEEKITGAIAKNKEKRDKKKKEKSPGSGKTKKDLGAEQKKADESKLANLLNKGMFLAIPCPGKQLKETDLQDINLGGAIVGTLQYYLPDFNFEHPVVILVIRIIMLVAMIKKMCFSIKKTIDNAFGKISGSAE